MATLNTSTDSEMDMVVVKKVYSPLEALPKELLWKVFEYTPELALSFRLASHTLKNQMDAFAVGQSTIPLVSPFSVSDFRLPGSTKVPGEYGLMFDVPKETSGLFYLRLSLTGHKDFKEEIRKMQDKKEGEEELVATPNLFDIKLNVDDDDHDEKVEKINSWIGRKVGRVQCQNVYTAQKLEGFTNLIKNTQFVELKIIADKMSDDAANSLLKTMVTHKITQLYMAGQFETTTDTVNLLRKLAFYIRSIQINQTPYTPPSESNESTLKRLFGTNSEDWGTLIVDLFRGALDKLCIVNGSHPGYLTASQTDKLKEDLTSMDKKVWFTATCDNYPEGYQTDAYNGYDVKVNAPAAAAANQHNQQQQKCKQYLNIVHESRAHEKPMEPVPIDAK